MSEKTGSVESDHKNAAEKRDSDGSGKNMTDEEVQALTSDQLIEMVATDQNIPYEQMTDDQLDLMEHGAKNNDGQEAQPGAINNNVEEAAAAPAVKQTTSHQRFMGGDGSLLCKVCNKKVYENEKISVSGSIYHRSCFRCAHCNNILRPTTYCLSPNGECYCKPHFDQLFKVKGTYNLESHSDMIKKRNTDANATNPASKDLTEEEEVALPDLKNIKSRFEAGATDFEGKSAGVDIGSANVSSLKSQWTSMGASQKPSGQESQNDMSDELGRERPETIAGGLASVKGMFEGGARQGTHTSATRDREADESLQAALASGAKNAKSLFESGRSAQENASPPKPFATDEDELAAIRASRGTNVKALFEQGRSSDGIVEMTRKHEDESLAAARAQRSFSQKAKFEGGKSETFQSKRQEPIDVQAGKAKDLLSKWENGQVNGDSNNSKLSNGAKMEKDNDKTASTTNCTAATTTTNGITNNSEVLISTSPEDAPLIDFSTNDEDVNAVGDGDTRDVQIVDYAKGVEEITSNIKAMLEDPSNTISPSTAHTPPPPVIISTVEDNPPSPPNEVEQNEIAG